MSARTHTLSGPGHGAKHFPIYQAALVVYCQTCSHDHRLLISSDDRGITEAHMDSLIKIMRDAGLHPTAAMWESYHPGTDLSVRDWDSVELALDVASYEAPDRR